MKKTVEEIALSDGRYKPGGLYFVYEGLGETIESIRKDEGHSGQSRHITGAELSLGLARIAAKRWGLLAKMVLNGWGIYTSRDMGEIVYLMIANNWMTAQDSDEIEDFDDVFDFDAMFKKQFRFSI